MTARWILFLIAGFSISGCAFLDIGPRQKDPVNGTTYPATVPTRSLNEAPTAESFVGPGIEGLYAELQADAARVKSGLCGYGIKPHPSKGRLAPYTRYQSPETPANPAAFNIRQIVIKFVEGSAVRLRDGQLQQVKETDAVGTRERLARAGLEPDDVLRDFDCIQQSR